MNLWKCAFGVLARNFLAFSVHWWGIEVDNNNVQTIIEAELLKNKMEQQSLIEKINFLRSFVSNSSG